MVAGGTVLDCECSELVGVEQVQGWEEIVMEDGVVSTQELGWEWWWFLGSLIVGSCPQSPKP